MFGVKQRFIHFYFLNELINISAIVYLLQSPLDFLTAWPHLFRALLLYICFVVIQIALVVLICCFRRQFRPSSQIDTNRPLFPLPKFKTLEHTTRDGVKLRVSISEPANKKSFKVMFLAAPLGQCGPSIYNPLMAWYGEEYTYVTWDYRGFFGATSPDQPRHLSIPEHARDGLEVLKVCGFDYADVMVGHSMGVAVCLETVLIQPKKIGSLILMNGFHGQVFSTAFQPLWRFPFAGDCVTALIEFLLEHPNLLETLRLSLRPIFSATLPLYARMFGSTMMKKISGERYLLDFLDKYMGTLCESRRHLDAWLRLFQELDAHSVFHLLRTIKQPVLLISGGTDLVFFVD